MDRFLVYSSLLEGRFWWEGDDFVENPANHFHNPSKSTCTMIYLVSTLISKGKFKILNLILVTQESSIAGYFLALLALLNTCQNYKQLQNGQLQYCG